LLSELDGSRDDLRPLRTEGIACDHRQTDIGAGAGDTVGDSGPREILVARADLENARQLVTTDAS
jgi:hypothetical protein